MADTGQESTNAPRSQKDNGMSQSQSRVQRLSSAVEKTVDKLSRSVQVSVASSSPSRVFSINRESNQATSRSRATPSNEDSPFIRPASPPLRPDLGSFAGDGSV
jgi:sterol 3beta-glucosyltransferase